MIADTDVASLECLLSFAAGAMLYVVVEELIPEMSSGEHSNIGVVFFCRRLQPDDGTGRGTRIRKRRHSFETKIICK